MSQIPHNAQLLLFFNLGLFMVDLIEEAKSPDNSY